MYLENVIVSARDTLVHWLSGVDRSKVLNPVTIKNQERVNSLEVAGEIKAFINQIKAEAFNEAGFMVDYAKLAESISYQTYRQECVSKLQAINLSSINSTSDKLGFWINLYNALIVDAVIQLEIQKSVTEDRLGLISFFEKAAYRISEQRFSLTDIEHGILRANRGFPYFPGPHFSSQDPRRKWMLSDVNPKIHFALNCASRSCPPIGVYSADQIANQLDLAAYHFVDQDILVDPGSETLSLSSIFRWYQVDFGGRLGVIKFLIEHLPDDDRKTWLQSHKNLVKLRFKPYDWGLNTVF